MPLSLQGQMSRRLDWVKQESFRAECQSLDNTIHSPPQLAPHTSEYSQKPNSKPMESSLHQVWESASGNPFVPTIGKGSQFFVGFSLLTIGLLLTGLFGLSMLPQSRLCKQNSDQNIDRSIITVPLIGVPASLVIAYVPSFLPLI